MASESLFELSRQRKCPLEAKLIGSAVGLVLGAASGSAAQSAGVIPNHGPWLERIGRDPQQAIQDLDECSPDDISNHAIHSLMSFLHRTPELSEDSLSSMESEPGHCWSAPLATIGRAVLRAASRCMHAPGRMPMDPSSILVCVDGSRLSYLALEVAASLRKHGKLFVLHVEEEARSGSSGRQDLSVDFIVSDLKIRCRDQLRIAPHRFQVVTVPLSGGTEEGQQETKGDDGASSLSEAVERVIQEENIDTVVFGCFGTAGPRIGSLGSHANWAITSLLDVCTVVANPYSSLLPPTGGIEEVMRPSVFMVVIRAERPLNELAVKRTLRLMSHWHTLLVYVFLNEKQTKAEATKSLAQPPLAPVMDDLRDMLVQARLSSPSAAGSSGVSVGSLGTAGSDAASSADGDMQRRSTVKLQPYVSTKKPEQLVVDHADAERVDFVAIDRSLGIHDGVIKSCRASVMLLPASGKQDED